MSDSWVKTSDRLPTEEEHRRCRGNYLLSDGFRVERGTYDPENRNFGNVAIFRGQEHFVVNESALYWQAIRLPERKGKVK